MKIKVLDKETCIRRQHLGELVRNMPRYGTYGLPDEVFGKTHTVKGVLDLVSDSYETTEGWFIPSLFVEAIIK